MKTKIISISLLLFLIVYPAKAQQWEFVGLDTFMVRQLFVSGDWIWAVSDYRVGNQIKSNLYFSSNVGNSWKQIDSSLGNDHIYGLTVIPPTTLFLLKVGVLHKSINNGTNWQTINNISNNPLKTFRISPFNTNEMYAIDLYFAGGIHNDLYKSTNGGASWELIGAFPSSSHGNELSFAFDDTDSLNLYVSDDDHWSSLYFFKSTDKGETWFYVSSPPVLPASIYSDYFISERVYLFPGPYVSNNSGYTWLLADSGLTDTSYSISFYRDKLTTELLYLLRSDGIFYSDPNLINWQVLESSNNLPVAFSDMRTMFIQSIENELYLGTNEGIYKTSILTTVQDDKDIINNFYLSQNYPNPFNPTTTINYSVPKTSNVSLIVYDVIGREIKTLVNGEKLPGNYSVQFDGSELPSGVYFYTLKASSYVDSKKMVLIK
mgnify:CR=1 FL=1